MGGGGGWHKASVSDCLPLAAPIGLSPPLILTLCGPERVLVVSTEPPDDLSCLTVCTGGGGIAVRERQIQLLIIAGTTGKLRENGGAVTKPPDSNTPLTPAMGCEHRGTHMTGRWWGSTSAPPETHSGASSFGSPRPAPEGPPAI